MLLSVALGALCGLAGFVPLLWGLHLARKATPTSNLGHATALLLGVLVSFAILSAGFIVTALIARDLVLPFVAAQVIVLSLVAVLYGVKKLLR